MPNDATTTNPNYHCESLLIGMGSNDKMANNTTTPQQHPPTTTVSNCLWQWKEGPNKEVDGNKGDQEEGEDNEGETTMTWQQDQWK